MASVVPPFQKKDVILSFVKIKLLKFNYFL
jgi:hypothetical protein